MTAVDPRTAPRATPPLDWRAIAIGAGASLGIAYAANYLVMSALTDGGVVTDHRTALWLGVVLRLTSVFADALGGALAGLLARQRGALHGGLAAVLATAGGTLVMLVRMAMHGGFGALTSLSWIAQFIAMAALGIGVAALAGFVAARIAARSPQG